MKNMFKMILPVILLTTFLCGSASAQSKVATVNLQKLFDNYWKTKQSNAAIQAKANELLKDENTTMEELKKENDDYQNLLQQANDPGLSNEERDKRKQAADAKLKDLQERKAAFDQIDHQARATLSEQMDQMRSKVLAEIQAAVSAKAKAAGYALVIDTAARTVNNTTTVLYTNGENDLTDAILAQLNVGAPIDVTKPAAMTTTPSLMSTNFR